MATQLRTTRDIEDEKGHMNSKPGRKHRLNKDGVGGNMTDGTTNDNDINMEAIDDSTVNTNGKGGGGGGGGGVPPVAPAVVAPSGAGMVVEEPQTMSLSANKTSATLEDFEKLKKEYGVRKSQLKLIKEQFDTKKRESMNLEKQMQKRREVWQLQRERIIEKYFAQLPKDVTKHHNLTKQLNKKKNQNMCIKTSLDIVNSRLQNELMKLTRVYQVCPIPYCYCVCICYLFVLFALCFCCFEWKINDTCEF